MQTDNTNTVGHTGINAWEEHVRPVVATLAEPRIPWLKQGGVVTRTCETLGVFPGQRFKIIGYRDYTFYIEDGVLWEEDGWNGGLRDIADSSVLMEIIDDPGLVMVGEDITANERSLLFSLCSFMGIMWLAKDSNGMIGLFTDKPERGLAAWYATSGSKVWFEQFISNLVSWEDEGHST